MEESCLGARGQSSHDLKQSGFTNATILSGLQPVWAAAGEIKIPSSFARLAWRLCLALGILLRATGCFLLTYCPFFLLCYYTPDVPMEDH